MFCITSNCIILYYSVSINVPSTNSPLQVATARFSANQSQKLPHHQHLSPSSTSITDMDHTYEKKISGHSELSSSTTADYESKVAAESDAFPASFSVSNKQNTNKNIGNGLKNDGISSADLLYVKEDCKKIIINECH